jgi:hypothetical protein
MIDYSGIQDKITEILDDELVDVSVFSEAETVGSTAGPEVSIHLIRESNTETTLGSPTPYNTVVDFAILCSEFSPDGVREACRLRDSLVGKVKDVIHANRSLSGLVLNTQFGDTEFDNARGAAGFYSAATLTLRVFATS